MKRITITVPDSADLSDLSGRLLSLALTFSVETVPDTTPPPTRRRKRSERQTVGGVERCIMAHFAFETHFSMAAASKWCVESDYSPASASPALSTLVRAGYVSRSGSRRSYTFTFLKPLED
jgi:hypothetical protein